MHSLFSLPHPLTLSLTNHGTALASAQASIWGDFSECYDDSICTSPDASGDGTDCWTLLGHDTCSCSRGRPKTTGRLTSSGVSFFYVSPLPQDACSVDAGGYHRVIMHTVDLWVLIIARATPYSCYYRVYISPSINAAPTARARRRRERAT